MFSPTLLLMMGKNLNSPNGRVAPGKTCPKEVSLQVRMLNENRRKRKLTSIDSTNQRINIIIPRFLPTPLRKNPRAQDTKAHSSTNSIPKPTHIVARSLTVPYIENRDHKNIQDSNTLINKLGLTEFIKTTRPVKVRETKESASSTTTKSALTVFPLNHPSHSPDAFRLMQPTQALHTGYRPSHSIVSLPSRFFSSA